MDKDEISCRKIVSQNIVHKLINRETFGAKKPATESYVSRSFYSNIFPNFTVINVEKPPCFLRKFSPNGKFFIAFSADQASLEIYTFQGSSAAADLVQNCKGEYVGHKAGPEANLIRGSVFDRFFKLKWLVNVAPSSEQLNRECSLFTEDGKYIIVGSAAYIPDELRPHFYEIYTNNEAVTPNPRSPLEDYSLHIVDLFNGRLCDTKHFKTDKIILSHNQGLYLFKDTLAVLSMQHQAIHVFQIVEGMFINVRTVGRFCYDDDSYLLSSVYPVYHTFRPFREQSINALKNKMMIFLFKEAMRESSVTGSPWPVRNFYQYFDQFRSLRMWKMQLLDENNLLIKYASEDVVTHKASEPNSQPFFFMIYNMLTAEVVGVYDNTSEELLYMFEHFCDHFRNTRSQNGAQFMCSPSNNIFARVAQRRFKQTIVSARFGGQTEATKRMLAHLPVSAQSYSSSPYLDLSLFSYDDKWVSAMERPKACGEHPIRFYGRNSGLLKFRICAGHMGRPAPASARRLVAFTFHPSEPFAISVQRTNSDYVVNFHIRHNPS